MATPDTRTQFNQISAHIKNQEMAQALALLKPILAKEPGNPEAWWLAAHAAPTPEAAIQAFERLLSLQPDYQPARQKITELKLKQAAVLLKQAQGSDVERLVRPIVAEQPDNIEALWLLARAVAVPKEALEICLHMLTLQPDHEGAKRLIETKQQVMAAAEARRKAKRFEGRSSPWLIVGGITVLLVAGLGVLTAISIVSTSVSKLMTRDLGSITESGPFPYSGDQPFSDDPSGLRFHTYDDSLPPDGQHDYKFTASAYSDFVGLVLFRNATTNPARAMTLIGPDGKQIASASPFEYGGQKGTAMIQVELPSEGTYILRLKGIPNVAQGAYRLELVVEGSYDMQ